MADEAGAPLGGSEQNANPSGAGGSDNGGNPNPTGGTNPAMEKRLSEENARYRTRLKGIAETLGVDAGDPDAVLRKAQEIVANAGTPPAARKPEAPAAAIQRELDETRSSLETLKKQLQDKENKGRQKILHAGLREVVAAAGLNDPDAAVELLTLRSRVADDDAVVFTITDENGVQREVIATAENLRQHAKDLRFPAVFFPADGVGGAGSRAPAAGGGLDFQKIGSDPALYAKHREAVLASMRAGKIR